MQSPLYQMNELSLDLMHAVACNHHRVVRLSVHAEDSQKGFCYRGEIETYSQLQKKTKIKMLLG